MENRDSFPQSCRVRNRQSVNVPVPQLRKLSCKKGSAYLVPQGHWTVFAHIVSPESSPTPHIHSLAPLSQTHTARFLRFPLSPLSFLHQRDIPCSMLSLIQWITLDKCLHFILSLQLFSLIQYSGYTNGGKRNRTNIKTCNHAFHSQHFIFC